MAVDHKGAVLEIYVALQVEFAKQGYATQWLWTYNNDRTNMGIGGIIPARKLKMAVFMTSQKRRN